MDEWSQLPSLSKHRSNVRGQSDSKIDMILNHPSKD